MFAKVIDNILEVYPYNPQVDHPLTSFPVGASYPDFNCYWVHPTAPNNPNPSTHNPGEGSPVFNTVTNRWEQSWTFVEKPPVVAIPNWDGLYQTLLGSLVYQHLVGLSLQFPQVDSALDKVIAAIGYGDKRPDSQVAFDAFQSAVALLLYALGLVEQELSTEQLDEIRDALDGNGFEGITL